MVAARSIPEKCTKVNKPSTRKLSIFMASGKQETNYILVFGIAETLIAFMALLVASVQAMRTMRVHHIFELA
jgi:hypothetical protein